jgi:hypothetical protein
VVLFLFAKFQGGLSHTFLKTLCKKERCSFYLQEIAGGGQRTLYVSLKKNGVCFFNRSFRSIFFKKTIAI